MYLSLLLILVSFFLLKGILQSDSKLKKYVILITFYLNYFLLTVYVLFNFLSGDGINDAIIFHVKFGISGFGFNEYIIPSIIFIFFNLIAFSSSRIFLRNLTDQKTKLITNKTLSLTILVLSIIFNPFYKDIYELLSDRSNNYQVDKNSFYEQDIIFSDTRKNIVFIYLEQIERTYLNEDLFPNLLPNLKTLEKQSISFTNIDSPRATNWTIAGMAATQCGVPLLTPIASENSMSGMDKFLPLANCMGDILNEESYKLHYIGGSDLDFAGKGNFYKTHNFDSVEGWYELQNKIKDINYRSPWGVYDDELLDIVYDRIEILSKANENFGLFTLTLDTHHPNGYISASCENKIYGDGTNSILNSIHCVDELIGKFMEKFLNSEIYNNTTLVLLSDHLALKNTASEVLKNANRSNLFMIFDKDAKPQLINDIGNSFDIGPTVMSFLGANTNGLGLGRNLITNESLSLDLNINEVIDANKRKILELWSFPKIDQGFSISIDQLKIFFGNRYINFPALIVLNSSNEVDQIMFDFYYANPLSNKVNRLNKNVNFIWLDKCEKIFVNKFINNNKNKGYCILLENKKNSQFEVIAAEENRINSAYLKNFFNNE